MTNTDEKKLAVDVKGREIFTMTKGDLIAAISEYPDDIEIFIMKELDTFEINDVNEQVVSGKFSLVLDID